MHHALDLEAPQIAGDHAPIGPLEILRDALSGVPHTLAPDQHVTLEGSERRTVIGVVSGTLRCFRMTPDGRRHITRFVGAGGLIGLGKLGQFRTSTEAVSVSTIIAFRASAVDVLHRGKSTGAKRAV